MIGAPNLSATSSSSSVAFQGSLAAKNCDFLSSVQDFGGPDNVVFRRESCPMGKHIGGVVSNVSLLTFADHLVLQIDWKIDVGHASIPESRTTSKVDYILRMGRSHYTGIIDRYVSKQPVEVYILLGVRIDQIMVMMPGDG